MSRSSSRPDGGRLSGRLRGLARRVRDRVSGDDAPAGNHFDSSRDVAFAVLSEEGDSAFQRVGASLVSAWEVGLTDFSRALVGRVEDAPRRRVVERLSDALVPTQQPFNDAKAAFSRAVQDGLREGLAAGRLDAATAPVTAVISGVGSDVAAGWEKTTDYLGPVWTLISDAGGDADAVRADFAAVGPALQAALDAPGAELVAALSGLAEVPDLETAVRDATERWYEQTSRAVEVTVYEARTVLVKAAKSLPEG